MFHRSLLHVRPSAAHTLMGMSIATVIVFWTPVEIMGRNNLFQEIWVAPLEHVSEMLLILSAFILLGIYMIYTSRRKKKGL